MLKIYVLKSSGTGMKQLLVQFLFSALSSPPHLLEIHSYVVTAWFFVVSKF
jgi:hypothetical protein